MARPRGCGLLLQVSSVKAADADSLGTVGWQRCESPCVVVSPGCGEVVGHSLDNLGPTPDYCRGLSALPPLT